MADYAHAAAAAAADDSSSSSDQHSPPPASSSKKNKNSHHHHHHHHHQQLMVIESSSTPENATRKPRGRPPGSKNKPKPPVVITRDITDSSAMKPVILEISAGADIIDSVITFARRNHAGISLVSASGSVSHVTLRQPISHAHSLSLHGPFHLLSLSGSFYDSSSYSSPSSFGVTLAGAQGQVFGGIVAGKVTAASKVVVVAATFLNPLVHSLPISSDEGDNQVDAETKPNIVGASAATESCSSAGKTMPVYGVAAVAGNPTPLSCQIPPDHHHVMHWAPPSRPPNPNY